MKKDFIFELYNSKKSIFTLKDISLLLGENNFDSLKSKIHYYVNKGIIKALRRGIYAKPEYDPFELAARIYTPSYISLESVLQKEGVIFQYYNSIFAVTYLSRTIKVDGREIVYRKIKYPILLNKEGIIQNESYAVAAKERAFLDALYLYKTYSFDNVDILDKNKIEKLLPLYHSKKLEKEAKRIIK